MRALIAAPLLGLSLLGGCAQPQYLLSERTDPAPTATTDSLRDVRARYTDHAASTAKTEVVSLHLGNPVTADEKIRIVAAIDEWNHVLNGAARFDLSPTVGGATDPGAWRIMMIKTPWKIQEQNNPQPLSSVFRLPTGGGLIMIYGNRLEDPAVVDFGDHSLRGVMVHELGIVLGAGNDPSLFTSHVEDCIDRNMAMAVAKTRDLPTDRLNWCESHAAAK